MIRQTLSGVVSTVKCDGAEDDILPLLAGRCEVYDLKFSGGSYSPHPAVLNRKRIAVGNKSHKVSCSFSVPHMKPTASYVDIEGALLGKFDAHYDVDFKCDYVNLIYDKI